MERTYHNPSDLPDWSSFFSQVICVEGYGLRDVFISGQVGVDAQKQGKSKGTHLFSLDLIRCVPFVFLSTTQLRRRSRPGCWPRSSGRAVQTPNQALQQTAGHDSFLGLHRSPVPRRC